MTLSKTALAVLAVLAALPFAAMAEDEEIMLRIDGASGMRFSASCLLNAAAGKESIAIDQVTPFRTTFQGSGLSCEVTAGGAIEVEVIKGGSRSSSGVSRGTARVNVGS